MMSLVLVYAGTPTIFANFRTFIRLYFTIFHSYIALLHRSSTSQLYIAVLHRSSTSHSYVASHPMSHRNLCRIATYVASQPMSHHNLRGIATYIASHCASLHHITTALCHST